MITCEAFREHFTPATEDAAVLEHIRSCDVCLNFAAEIDADVLFRAIGGSEMVPPGGVDAFVDDVMRAVRIRGTENSVATNVLNWPRKLALAATVALAIAGATFMTAHRPAPAAPQIAAVRHHVFPTSKAAARPVIENYDSERATIVEVPTAGEDVKVVMVFDESLPADL
ncbi:MAG TPA: hypothetical protein VF980_13310 [Thermoanaerobaculia bacterium]